MGGSRDICADVRKMEEAVKKSKKRSRVKRQAAGGQDQFGGAVLKVRAGTAATSGGRGNPSQLMNWKAVLIAWPRRKLQGKQRWMNWSRPIPP